MKNRLARPFYTRPALEVARDLLGRRLVRIDRGSRIAGLITETEAYCGESDLACHARAGRTPRTAVMYGPAGHAYVYFTYGMHWMLNFVTELPGEPGAVLIRGIRPEEGLKRIAARRRGRPRSAWTDGPAKICQAMDITGKQNGLDVTVANAVIFVESGVPVGDDKVVIGPRVGIDSVPEPWKSKPWRFRVNTER